MGTQHRTSGRSALVPARSVALGLGLALVLVSCGGGSGGGGDGARNLLLISIDTLRADALGSYGSVRGASPFLDAWAARGVRFANAWSPSPKTAPAHMTMLTGLPPRVHGVGNLGTAGGQRLGPRPAPLAEILGAAGFRTGGFTSGGNVKASQGFDRGFAYFEDRGGVPWPIRFRRLRRWFEAGQGERWFAFFHTYRVHDPYFADQELIERFADPSYSGDILGDPELLLADVEAGRDLAPDEDNPGKHKIGNFWRRVDSEDPADLRHLHDLYLAALFDLDRELEALFTWLQRNGHLEDTLVVVTSDHGEEFGEHGGTRHDQLWREVLHVPLLVRLPGDRAAGQVLDARVGHVDLVPSLLELLDVADPEPQRVGASWAPWIEEPDAARPRPQYAEHRSRLDGPLDLWALRADDWLLHRSRDGTSLHDLARDPAELEAVEAPERRGELERLQLQELARRQALAELFASDAEVELTPEEIAELEALGYL